MYKLSALLLPFLFAAPTSVAAPPATVPQHRVTFEFHSAFLMNLHHFLYDMAVHKDKLESIPWPVMPTAPEVEKLRAAVAFYRGHYGELDLLFDPTMTSIKRALSVSDTKRDTAGLALPPDVAAVLETVAPIYERCMWQMHNQSNRNWIVLARTMNNVYGPDIQAGIERHLGAPFPTAPIRDDVVFDTGTRQGAYTDEQTVMPSSRADYLGLAALEMLYHEASHTTVTAPLEAAIAARLKATGRKDDSDLWHVAQFYTVGKVTHDVLARSSIEYRTYAEQRGLYTGYWAPLMPAVESAWVAHMDGKLDLQEAVRQMVDRLPPP